MYKAVARNLRRGFFFVAQSAAKNLVLLKIMMAMWIDFVQ